MNWSTKAEEARESCNDLIGIKRFYMKKKKEILNINFRRKKRGMDQHLLSIPCPSSCHIWYNFTEFAVSSNIRTLSYFVLSIYFRCRWTSKIARAICSWIKKESLTFLRYFLQKVIYVSPDLLIDCRCFLAGVRLFVTINVAVNQFVINWSIRIEIKSAVKVDMAFLR